MSDQQLQLTQKEKELIMSSRRNAHNSSHPDLPASQTHLNPGVDNSQANVAEQSFNRPKDHVSPEKDDKIEDFDWADDDKSMSTNHVLSGGQYTTSTKYGNTRVMSPDEVMRMRQTNIRSANELFEASKKSKQKQQTKPFHYDRFAVRSSENVTPPLSQRTTLPVTESPTHIGGAPKVPDYLIKETKKKRQLANAGIYGMDGDRNVALP